MEIYVNYRILVEMDLSNFKLQKIFRLKSKWNGARELWLRSGEVSSRQYGNERGKIEVTRNLSGSKVMKVMEETFLFEISIDGKRDYHFQRFQYIFICQEPCLLFLLDKIRRFAFILRYRYNQITKMLR